MRRCSCVLVVLILVASFAVAQDPAGAVAQTSSTQATSAPPIKLEPDASGAISQEQFRELLRYAQDREVENEKRLRDYTYIEREEERKLDGNGQVKKIETRTHEVLEVYS